MKNRALGTLLAGVLAACGGGDVKLLDASVDAPTVCNPIAKTGCMTGEKCTWIVDIDGNAMTADIGHTGCVPDGTTADGDPCMDAMAAVNGGADTCIAGELCISGKCKPICDPQLVSGAGAGACSADYACSRYRGVFVSGTTATAGVCEPGCDPLTQKLKVGMTNLEACGSRTATQPSATCVPSSGQFKSFSCAPSGSMLYGNTDRVAPLGDSQGFFINGCAPGFIPFYFEDASGAMKTLCSGLCSPAKVDATIAAMAGNAKLNEGNVTVAGKLVADATAIAGHATCAVGIKGSDGDNGEDCRYLWFPLAISNGGDPTKPVMTPYNNTLGICFAFAKFLTIRMPGTMTLLPEKSCAKLPAGTVDPSDPYGSAEENGCYPTPNAPAPPGPTLRQNPHRIASFRLSNGDGMAVRHVFD